jgi:hypothetical protein
MLPATPFVQAVLTTLERFAGTRHRIGTRVIQVLRLGLSICLARLLSHLGGANFNAAQVYPLSGVILSDPRTSLPSAASELASGTYQNGEKATAHDRPISQGDCAVYS